MDRLNERYCTYLYWTWKDTPAWLSKLKGWKLIDDNEFLYLEELDESYSGTDLKVKKWDSEIKKNGNEIYFMDDFERKERLMKMRNEILNTVREMIASKANYLDIKIYLAQNGIEFKKHKQKNIKENVANDEITRARNYPIEKLVGKERYVLCPFHDDKKPSLYIKNGFGYCFSCQEKVDSIRWIMKTKNISFVEAIKALS